MARWQVPGLAIAVVKDAHVDYVGGLGVRELGKPERMDADTLFTIASVTKAFAGMAAAVAVDRGQIQWDEAVIHTLPRFRLYDPYVTAEATFRDLFSHRVGVSGDYVNGMALSRSEMVGLLEFARPVAPFRTARVYSNLLYAAAGEAVASAAGMSWDDHVRQVLFEPLGMTSSSTSARSLAEAPNRASSHVRGRDGVVRVDPFRPDGWWSMDNHAPAGGINSTARDMARWLEFQLGDGSFRGRRLLAQSAFDETHLDQVIYQDSHWNADPLEFLIGFRPMAYTLGWQSSFYGDERMLWHGGGFRGHGCVALLDPARKLGIFVFANSRDGMRGFSSGIAQWILDRYLDRPEKDWAEEQRQRYEQRWAKERQDERLLLQRPAKVQRASLEPVAYVGTYAPARPQDWPKYTVSLQLGVLRIDLAKMAEPYFATLEHWNGNAFRPTWNETVTQYEPAGLVSFTLGAKGQVYSMLFYPPGSADPEEFFRIEDGQRARPEGH